MNQELTVVLALPDMMAMEPFVKTLMNVMTPTELVKFTIAMPMLVVLILMVPGTVLVMTVTLAMVSHVKTLTNVTMPILLVSLMTVPLMLHVTIPLVPSNVPVTTVTSETEQSVKMLMNALTLMSVTLRPLVTIILVVSTVHVMMDGKVMV